MPRRRRQDPPRPTKYMICTEGKTEKLYLQALVKELGIARRFVFCKQDGGCGRRSCAMVSQAQQCAKGRQVEEVWLVCDLDEADDITSPCYRDFCDAFGLAAEAGYHMIVNVPCFEYWLLLHRQDLWTYEQTDACIRRFKATVNKRRSERKLKPYTKDEHKNDPELFALLGGMESAAQARERVMKLLRDKGIKPDSLKKLSTEKANRLFRDRGRPLATMPLLIDKIIAISKKDQ